MVMNMNMKWKKDHRNIYVYDLNDAKYTVIDVAKNDVFESVFVPEISATETG